MNSKSFKFEKGKVYKRSELHDRLVKVDSALPVEIYLEKRIA